MDDETENVLSIPVDDVALEGELIVPDGATGLVVFAYGSGSSRHSPRNNFVAETLQERGLGTLLFDLLTEQEDQNRENRFDIPLLTDRLVAVTQWLRDRTGTTELTIGNATIADWVRMTDDIDEACQAQIDLLRDHPLIHDEVDVHGYVYEVESDALRRPGERVAEQINTRVSK